MSDLTPKRGFVYRETYRAYLAGPPVGGRIFAVDSVFNLDMIPVLVVPEPDREPTAAEVVELARRLLHESYPMTAGEIAREVSAFNALPVEQKVLVLDIAHNAFRLGARVQP